MNDTPVRLRTRDEFFGVMAVEAGGCPLDFEAAARAVFRVLADNVSPGEIEDVKSNLPDTLRELWPA